MYPCRPRPNIDVTALARLALLPKIQESMKFILAIKDACLTDKVAKLNKNALEWLCNPPRTPLMIESLGIHHSIFIYLALEHSSQSAYKAVYNSTQHNFAGAPGVDDMLTFQSVESHIAMYTSVEDVCHDMCPNSCIIFTGPYSKLETCFMCNAS